MAKATKAVKKVTPKKITKKAIPAAMKMPKGTKSGMTNC